MQNSGIWLIVGHKIRPGIFCWVQTDATELMLQSRGDHLAVPAAGCRAALKDGGQRPGSVRGQIVGYDESGQVLVWIHFCIAPTNPSLRLGIAMHGGGEL